LWAWGVCWGNWIFFYVEIEQLAFLLFSKLWLIDGPLFGQVWQWCSLTAVSMWRTAKQNCAKAPLSNVRFGPWIT
jgi:hypothetical protein